MYSHDSALAAHSDGAGGVSSLSNVPDPAQAANRLFERSGYAELQAVSCHYHEGILTLRGQVSSYYLKQVAQTIAMRAAGVDELHNQIRVARAARPTYRAQGTPIRLGEAELRRRLAQAYASDPQGTSCRIVMFTELLRSQYPDWPHFRYYHLLVGSTPQQNAQESDFPNEEVQRFVLNLL